jgi:hypothetical protein
MRRPKGWGWVAAIPLLGLPAAIWELLHLHEPASMASVGLRWATLIAIGTAWFIAGRNGWRYRKGLPIPPPHKETDPPDTLFLEGLTHLQAYIAEHGHAQVPQAYVAPGGFRLGRWVHKHRAAYKLSQLDADQARQLEALPGWEWTADRRRPGAKTR